MSAPMGLAEPGDAELVAGVLAGDRDSFAVIYDRYADRLHDFCYSMLRDRHDAADATQDTFVLVAQRLAQLRDPTRLRPWLYAIARSEALRRIRARSRFTSDAEVADMADTGSGPVEAAEQAALAALVADAAAGLSDRDRALLDLHLRQGLEGAELGEAMGVSASHAYVLLHRLREQVERSLGALLIARLGREECPELDTLLASWDGRFSPLVRKRVARHVDGCDVCSARRRVVASPWALLSAVALVPAPLYLREQVMTQVELVAHRGAPLPGGPRARTRVLAAGAVLAVLAGAAVLTWQVVPGSPADPVAVDVSAPVLPVPAVPAPAVSPPAVSAPDVAVPDVAAPTAPPAVPVPDRSTVDPTTAAPPPDAPEALAAELAVSPQRIELGSSGRAGTVVLTNSGGGPLQWSAAPSERWLVVEPSSGTLDGGESVPVTLQAARDGRAVVAVAWDGGTVEVLVTSVSPRPRDSVDSSTAPTRSPRPAGRRVERPARQQPLAQT